MLSVTIDLKMEMVMGRRIVKSWARRFCGGIVLTCGDRIPPSHTIVTLCHYSHYTLEALAERTRRV